ncbi:hypothetical protein [Salinispira pacifica]
MISICTECRANLPETIQFPPNYDGGATVVTSGSRELILKHCEICGKLMVITRKVEEMAR